MTVMASEESFEPVPHDRIQSLTLRDVAVGESWGRPWHTTWFKLSATVPAIGERFVAHVDLGFSGRGDGFQVEGLAWQNGRRVQAVQPDRRLVPVEVSASGETCEVELWIEAAATPIIAGHAFGYGPTPLGDPRTAGDAPLYVLRRADLCMVDEHVAQLAVALQSVMDLVIDLEPRDPYRARLFSIVQDLEDIIDPGDVSGSAQAAMSFLRSRLRAIPGTPAGLGKGLHRIVATGHAHLDTAWLWPVRETRRKAVRTFVNAVDLLKRNGDMVFSHSQAQHYSWVQEDAPEVFAEVRRLVDRGQWEPVGGMWVETDLNLPAGESLLRQFVEGQRSFDEWFGRRSPVAFLPDDFGYPGSIPQLVRHAGARWFFSQKMSWNETNSFPHHSFWWEGIDGTRLFTHFSPIDTYNALLTPSQLRFAARNFRDHAGASQSLALFGHGDGGGGPTQEMVDRARFGVDLPSVPTVEFGSVENFFAAAHDEYAERAPVWVGEMYLEKHRGTYSSQVRTKQGNRRCERLLHELETWSALAGIEQPELPLLWRRVLVQQFHDIIPGSSIAWVHRETEDEHRQIAARIESLIEALPTGSEGDGGSLFAMNPAPVRRRELVVDGDRWALVDLPSFAARPVDLSVMTLPADVEPVTHSVSSTGDITIANGILSCTISSDGRLRSVVVAATGREVIGPDEAGRLQVRRDTPAEYDAWDIDRYDADAGAVVLTAPETSFILRADPATVQVATSFAHNDSRFRLLWSLSAGSSRLDLRLEADWRGSEERLQWTVPIDVMARDALCGIQFGHVRRPRHANTSWDLARFEVCAHRYVYVSEPGCGVALLADGPRGYDIRGRNLSLTLLRAPQFPDPTCDLGSHSIEWSLLVDSGEGNVSAVEEEAARVAHPIRLSGRSLVRREESIAVTAPGVLVSAVKLAADGSGDLVVRIWESRGARSRGTMTVIGRTGPARRCDALELPLAENDDTSSVAGDDGRSEWTAGVGGGTMELDMRPFEIRTYRLT